MVTDRCFGNRNARSVSLREEVGEVALCRCSQELVATKEHKVN